MVLNGNEVNVIFNYVYCINTLLMEMKYSSFRQKKRHIEIFTFLVTTKTL